MMRSDAKKNYHQLLAVARDTVAEQGAEASLRDVARRAGVGLGTLYRHFPTRDALLEALLRTSFDELAATARRLESSASPGNALVLWIRDIVTHAHTYRGIITAMVAAIEDPGSALHASCIAMRAAGARLLARAQAEGVARADIDGADLFALIGALVWLRDQAAFASRSTHLFNVVTSAIMIDKNALSAPARPSSRKSRKPTRPVSS
jgi:AcrR family transcriptional regulator